MSLAARYKFKAEIEEIYLYRKTPVIIWSTSYGSITMATLDDKFFADISCYCNQAKALWKRRIGKRIRPKWQKETLSWNSSGNLMSQRQYENDREYENRSKEWAIKRLTNECRDAGFNISHSGT